MNATMYMDTHDGKRPEVALVTRDVGLAHVSMGGDFSSRIVPDHVMRYMLARVESFESPFTGDDAFRVVQEAFDGTTYVVTDTEGYVSEEALSDVEFWQWLREDHAIVPYYVKDDEPHTGITCEYSGEVIAGPWYMVFWTDCDDPIMCEGPWDALSVFASEVVDTDEEENGWMLRAFDVTTGEVQEPGDLLFTKRSLAMNHTGDIDTTIEKWSPYGPGDTDRETYYHTWEFGDHDDANSPLNQFASLVNPEEHYEIFDVAGFASFVREDFGGNFIVNVDKYDG